MEDASGSLSVGVVGAGHISESIHLPVLDTVEDADVAYVADIDECRAKELAGAADARPIGIEDDPSVLPGCDVAALTVPVGVRSEYVAEFSRRGTPTFTEKPFATDIDAHRDLLADIKTITCNYNRRCYGSVRALRDAIEAGVFGAFTGATVSESYLRGTGIGTDHWRTDIAVSGGGILMEKGCHTLSQFDLLFPDRALTVESADLSFRGDVDVVVEATIGVGESDTTIEYVLTRTRNAETVARFRFENADVWFDHTDPESTLEVHAPESPVAVLRTGDAEAWATTEFQSMYLRWRDFLDRVRDDAGDPVETTSLRTTQLITDIYEAGGRGEVIGQ